MLENVPPLGDFWLDVLVVWHHIRAWIREQMEVDVTLINSCSHWFRWIWINLTLGNVIHNAYWLILRSPTCLVDDILDVGHHYCVVCHVTNQL
jgi:hypothetical protein